MASRSLGVLSLDLVAKTGQFTAGMTAAERQASKSFSAIEKRAKAFGTALGVGLVTAVTGLAALTKSAIDNADALRDSSIQLGISTETLSAYGYAAQQTGTDLAGLSTGLKILSKNLADAENPASTSGKVFAALGLSVTDAEGNLRKLDDILPDIADALQGMENGTQKAALMLQLFGKSGLELTELLSGGSEGLAEFTSRARELGLIVGTDTANAADEFNDKLADLKSIVLGVGNDLAAELLPRLIRLIDEFQEGTKESKLMADAISTLGDLFDVFVTEATRANEVGESFRRMLAATNNTVENLKGGLSDLVSLNITGFIKKMNEARNAATSALLAGFGVGAGPEGKTTAGSSRRGGAPMNMTPGVSTIDQQALSNALSGIREPKGKKTKEATKEVDKLDEAYKRLLASMKEEIALNGQSTEVARIGYELKNGELSKLSQAKKDELLGLAQQIDSMKEIAELEEAAKKAAEKESELIRDGIKATDEVIAQMEFELSLIGLRNDEIERAIALRHLDANATDEQRARVSELTDELIRASENQQFLDDFKEGLADAFTDFVTGAKSAKEAFGDFADELFKRAAQFVMDKAIEAMFSAFGGGSKQGGASGGGFDWTSLLSLFGGGKASGGPVQPGMFYRVNENGPELLSAGGKDYLMMGNQSGKITPNSRMGSGGIIQNNKFLFAAPTSQMTQEQMAQRSAQELSLAQRRNG